MARPPLIVYWSRRDFRLRDNPALFHALKESRASGTPFLPLFVLEDYMVQGAPEEQFGLSSRTFLAHALPQFAALFPQFVVARGKGAGTIISLQEQYQLTVHVNEDVYPDFYKQITKIEKAGITVHIHTDRLTVSKETHTRTGGLYSVFTPFKNAVRAEFAATTPLAKADVEDAVMLSTGDLERIQSLLRAITPAKDALLKVFSKARLLRVGNHTLDLAQVVPVETHLGEWYTTEEGALDHFISFLEAGMAQYGGNRNALGIDGTSRMSLALSWGLVSARSLVHLMQEYYKHSLIEQSPSSRFAGAETYLSELIWREFYAYLLYHHPELMQTEFQEKYRGTVSWVDDQLALSRFTAWIQGKTGYPLVDAAMQQLAKTGWMHNRARMVVASVLTKNLGVDWRWGQEYFRAALFDLDEASNNGGWQWAASVGADPKPIRIFNPELQAKNYDRDRAYQTTWLEDSYLNDPPAPIVPHKEAREDALVRYGLAKTTARLPF